MSLQGRLFPRRPAGVRGGHPYSSRGADAKVRSAIYSSSQSKPKNWLLRYEACAEEEGGRLRCRSR
jgi:hypothetical protein